ncbi:MAG TPA: nucleoside kinase, partial [Spirochaetia bacterium]|nr:nucleoside kinase [Spirochaetia bacterium]
MNVRVTFANGRTAELPAGTAVREAVAGCCPGTPPPAVAARVNNEVVSLESPLTVNCTVEPVVLEDKEGALVYRKSLCFLVAMASKKVFPRHRVVISHSLGQSYFYYLDGIEELSDDDAQRIETAMRDIVSRNAPIISLTLSYREAVEYFEKHNQPDTVLLLKNRNDPSIRVNSCEGYLDLSHGPLVPATGLLSVFAIKAYPPGFLLRYPPSRMPQGLGPFQDNPVLFSIYREYKNWGKILRVGSVGRLDELIRDGIIQEFIQVAEALQDKKIAEIADRITARRDMVRCVLIAGPSSSGKTTFSKKLMIQLRVVGRNPVTISLDDYYKPHDLTPLDEEGKPDYESLDALDVPLLNTHLVQLLAGEEVETPLFDFHAGARKPAGLRMRLPERAILI